MKKEFKLSQIIAKLEKKDIRKWVIGQKAEKVSIVACLYDLLYEDEVFTWLRADHSRQLTRILTKLWKEKKLVNGDFTLTIK